MFHNSLAITTLFYCSSFIKVKSPTTFGLHSCSQAIGVLLLFSVLPDHKNFLQIVVILERIFLGNTKIWDQKICIEYKTFLISWILSAYACNLAAQVVILPIILSIKDWHCTMDNLLVLNGTPRYLKGSSPLAKSNLYKICSCTTKLIPPK